MALSLPSDQRCAKDQGIKNASRPSEWSNCVAPDVHMQLLIKIRFTVRDRSADYDDYARSLAIRRVLGNDLLTRLHGPALLAWAPGHLGRIFVV